MILLATFFLASPLAEASCENWEIELLDHLMFKCSQDERVYVFLLGFGLDGESFFRFNFKFVYFNEKASVKLNIDR